MAAVLIIGGFADCNLKEKYARNKLSRRPVAAGEVGAAGVNVEGAWEAWESGWGDIRFEQIGSSVNGAMGNYSAEASFEGRGSSSP